MTGVINVCALWSSDHLVSRLLSSLSVSLVHLLPVCAAFHLYLSLHRFEPRLSLFTPFTCAKLIIFLIIIFTSIHMQPPTACCPWTSVSCNGNPLIYAAIVLLQYVNRRYLESHLWMIQHPFKLNRVIVEYNSGKHTGDIIMVRIVKN